MVSDQRHPKGEPSGAGPGLSPVELESFVVYMLPKRSSICALKTFRSRPPTDRARMSVQPNERIPDQTTHRSRLADGTDILECLIHLVEYDELGRLPTVVGKTRGDPEIYVPWAPWITCGGGWTMLSTDNRR